MHLYSSYNLTVIYYDLSNRLKKVYDKTLSALSIFQLDY